MRLRNVLYVHPSDELYGADRSLLRLVKSLNQSQYVPHVVVANDVPYEGLLTHELAKHHISYQKVKLGVLRRQYQNVPGMGLFLYRTLVSAVQLARYCRQQRIDLVHSNSTAVIAGGMAARLARVPHIWHVRELITQPTWLNKFMANNLLLWADQVIAVSQPVHDHLLVTQPRLSRKTAVIHNGIDPDPFLCPDEAEVRKMRQAWGAMDETVIVGMIGRISSWKGQEFLLEAVKYLMPLNTDVRIVLVGGNIPGEAWREAALRQLVLDLGLEYHVSIQEFRLDIPVVIAAFDVFVLPSTRPDPFPTVVLEAMAAAKPVVATAHGGALEQVKDKETGFLVSPTDPADMATAVHKLIHTPQQRHVMGRAGRARLLQHFTTARYVQEIATIYEQVLA
jgi:glycosyltransferase involved in cell wall biosynthesis